MKATIIAFLIGAAIPATYGVVTINQIRAYNAAHPPGPNEAGCGMATLGAVGMIVIVAPVTGAVSAAVCSLLMWLLRIANPNTESGISTTPD